MAIINGTPGNDVLVGTPEDDVIRGLDGNDVISGLEGNDQLDGGAGNDSIAGNQGNDSIFGGAGDDTLYGGQGNDLVIGEAGNDIIGGDAGTNTLTGGVGSDRFILTTAGTATITDFFAGNDFLGLSGDLTIDDIEVSQNFANTLVIDRRTGNVLATLNNVNAADLRRQNFLDVNGRPVNFAPTPATLVDVIATDPIARAANPDDPIVFTVSRTSTAGDLVVNFTLGTTTGVALQNPPTSVRIPNGQAFANVTVTPQATSRDGTVTITLQDSPNYDVRTGVATGTVSAPVSLPTPAPQPEAPGAPPFVDLVLLRSDIPNRPAQGEQAVALFTVGNRGTGRADRVVFDLTVPVDSDVVRVEPSQGVFTGFTGDSARTGIIKVELGNIDPNREATIRVTYVPKTTGNFLSSNARVTSAQPDVDPSNNFANANVTVVPSPPNLPVVSVVAAEDGIAREPDTTQLENTDRETPTSLVTRDFIFRRTGGDLSRPLTVNYTLEGTAQNGVDFAPIGSSVTFAPFETEVRVTIRPIQDRQVEGAEFVRLNLVPNPLVFRVNETRGENTARIEIVDVPNPVGPNPLPGTVVSLVAIDQFADEFRPPSASGGSTPGAVSPIRGVLRVTRDNTIGDLTVNVEISGTANRPDEPASDYLLFDTLGRQIPVSGGIARITIPDGERFIDVYLEAIDDDLSEGDEDAVFNLAPGASYVIGRPQDVAADRPALIRIRDNETPPTVRIDVVPGSNIGTEAGQTPILFTLTRTGDLSAPRTVVVEMPRPSRLVGDQLVFEPGTAARPRQIQRNGPFDSDGEDYTITGPTVFLGESNLTSFLGIANLSQFPPEQTSNRFLVVFPVGQATATFAVTPIKDDVTEATEKVIARIVPPPFPQVLAGGIVAPSDIPPQGFIVVGGAATGFIVDDVTPSIEIIAIDPVASELSFKTATFEIRRTGNLAQPLTVNYQFLPSGATPAVPGQDFFAIPPSQVVIPAGQTSAFITIFPNDDLIGESFEEFTIQLDPIPGFATRNNGRAIGFVTDELIQVPFFPGTPGPDRIIGTGNNDFLSGGDGDDTIEGNKGDDVLIGDEGDDRILGQDDNDLIIGGNGSDTIDGGAGNDTIDIGTGDDFTDVITGGSEADRFLFTGISPLQVPDLITDFTPGQGDVLVFRNDPFNFNLTPSQNIDPQQFQAVANFPAILANPFVPTLIYVGGGNNQGINGQLFYAPSGVPVAGALPGDAILLVQFTNLGAAPVITPANIQVLP